MLRVALFFFVLGLVSIGLGLTEPGVGMNAGRVLMVIFVTISVVVFCFAAIKGRNRDSV